MNPYYKDRNILVSIYTNTIDTNIDYVLKMNDNLFLKRVIAKALDRVEINNGTVYVNNKPIINNKIYYGFKYNETIPLNHYFFISLNNTGKDSFSYSLIEEKSIISRVIFGAR